MVPSSRRPRTPPFQGENTGSNPVGTIDNPLPLWYDCLIGTIAQLVEHTPDKGAVTGSSPVGSIPQQRWVEDVFHRQTTTSKSTARLLFWGCGGMVDAPDLKSVGQQCP